MEFFNAFFPIFASVQKQARDGFLPKELSALGECRLLLLFLNCSQVGSLLGQEDDKKDVDPAERGKKKGKRRKRSQVASEQAIERNRGPAGQRPLRGQREANVAKILPSDRKRLASVATSGLP